VIDDPTSRLIDQALERHAARFHQKGLPAVVRAVDPTNKTADVFLKGELQLFDDVPYDPELALAVGDTVRVQVQGGRSYFISSKARPVSGAAPSPGYGARIGEIVVSGASVSGLTFTNIPAIYRHLKLVILTRSTAAVTGTEIDVYFNNDTSAVYDYLYGILASTGWTQVNVLGAGAMELGTCAGASAPADAADATVIWIPGYSQTVLEKAALATTQQKRNETAGNVLRGVRAGWWRSTAAINRVDCFLGSGNFAIGTVATLFGEG
jgi:hypothetical protein